MMINKIRAAATAAIGLSAVAVVTPAFADYVFQTATAGTGGTGAYSVYSDATTGNGDGTDAGSNFIGSTFAVSGATSSLQVGGNFDGNGQGNIFAEVVSVASLATLPAVTGSGSNALISWLQSNNLARPRSRRNPSPATPLR